MSGFSEAFIPAYQASANAYNQKQELDQTENFTTMRDALLEKQRLAAQQRQREQLISDQLLELGQKPVLNPDGSMDLPASIGALGRAQRLKDALSYGIPTKGPAQAASPATTPSPQGQAPVAQPAPSFQENGPPPTPAPVDGFGKAPNAFPVPTPQAQPQTPVAPQAPAPIVDRPESAVMADIRAAKEAEQQKMFNQQIMAKDQAKDSVDFARLFGRDPTPDEVKPSGGITPAAQQALEKKRDEEAAGKQRATQIAYARALVQNSGLDPDSPEGQALFSKKLTYLTSTPDMKKAMDMTDGMVQAGVIPDDPKAIQKEQSRLLSFGGRPPQIGPAQQRALDGDAQALSNSIDLKADIDNFQKKYGVPFTDFVGPFDATTNSYKFKFLGTNTPAEKAAQNIYQRWAGIQNQKVLSQSGQAVTAGEMMRQEMETGNIKNANFPDQLNTFIQMNARSLANRTNVMSDFAGIDRYKKIKGKPVEDWMGNGGYGGSDNIDTSPQPSAAPQASPSQAGKYKIIKVQ